VPEQPVPILSDETLAKLLVACRGDTFENRRDTAIIRLFLDTGMRAGELAGLTVDDIDREQMVALLIGKGRPRACLSVRCPDRWRAAPLDAVPDQASTRRVYVHVVDRHERLDNRSGYARCSSGDVRTPTFRRSGHISSGTRSATTG
jgi:integrase